VFYLFQPAEADHRPRGTEIAEVLVGAHRLVGTPLLSWTATYIRVSSLRRVVGESSRAHDALPRRSRVILGVRLSSTCCVEDSRASGLRVGFSAPRPRSARSGSRAATAPDSIS
jgi:hypothetical protein